jgi:hypothetical protein
VTTWQELEQWFASHIEMQKRFGMTRGCPIGTVGSEITEHDELIRQDVALTFEVMKNLLAAFFIKEKAAGRLDPAADEDNLATYCIATIQGAMLMGKAFRDSGCVERTVREAITHLKGYARSGAAHFFGHVSIPARRPSLRTFSCGRSRVMIIDKVNVAEPANA